MPFPADWLLHLGRYDVRPVQPFAVACPVCEAPDGLPCVPIGRGAGSQPSVIGNPFTAKPTPPPPLQVGDFVVFNRGGRGKVWQITQIDPPSVASGGRPCYTMVSGGSMRTGIENDIHRASDAEREGQG